MLNRWNTCPFFASAAGRLFMNNDFEQEPTPEFVLLQPFMRKDETCTIRWLRVLMQTYFATVIFFPSLCSRIFIQYLPGPVSIFFKYVKPHTEPLILQRIEVGGVFVGQKTGNTVCIQLAFGQTTFQRMDKTFNHDDPAAPFFHKIL